MTVNASSMPGRDLQTLVPAAVEVADGQTEEGCPATLVLFGPVAETECEHTHVKAIHAEVQPWN
jgi:hypothetical protein